MATTPTPTPSPTVTLVPVEDDTLHELLGATPAGAIVIAMIGLMVIGTTVLIAWAVLRAAKYPPPTSLITALSLLSLLAILGGIATNNNAAWTIGAAGVGALAGSVTALFQQGKFTEGQVQQAVQVVRELERHEADDDLTGDDR